MFAMSKTPKVLKYQSKPLISLKYRKQAGRPHNPKVETNCIKVYSKLVTSINVYNELIKKIFIQVKQSKKLLNQI